MEHRAGGAFVARLFRDCTSPATPAGLAFSFFDRERENRSDRRPTGRPRLGEVEFVLHRSVPVKSTTALRIDPHDKGEDREGGSTPPTVVTQISPEGIKNFDRGAAKKFRPRPHGVDHRGVARGIATKGETTVIKTRAPYWRGLEFLARVTLRHDEFDRAQAGPAPANRAEGRHARSDLLRVAPITTRSRPPSTRWSRPGERRLGFQYVGDDRRQGRKSYAP